MKKIFSSLFFSLLFLTLVNISSVNAFSDVNVNTEQGRAIESLSSQKIINGYSNNIFLPGDNVTRGQAAKIISETLKLDTKSVKNPNFSDLKVNHQFYNYIAALENKGIITKEGDKFNPNEQITRGEVAKLLNKAFQFNSPIPTQFTDVENSKYKIHIENLYGAKITSGVSATKFGVSQKVTRGQFALFIHRIQKLKEPNQTNGIWKGTYYANQGETSLTLTIDQNIAVFDFGPTKNNPTVPKGLAIFSASHDSITDYVTLKGLKWIKRPSNYELVNFYGAITPNGKLSGFVESHGNLYTFELTNSKSTNNDYSVQGIWKGSYNNSTGNLSLNLEMNESQGSFNFSPLADYPNMPSGSFNYNIKKDNSGIIELKATNWISRPNNYVTVDLKGVVSKKGYMKGYLNNDNKLQFNVKLR